MRVASNSDKPATPVAESSPANAPETPQPRTGGRRKSTATETIYARVTPAVANKIRDLAAAENVSLGVIISRMAAGYKHETRNHQY